MDLSPLGRQLIAADSAARNRDKSVKARHSFDGTTHNHQPGRALDLCFPSSDNYKIIVKFNGDDIPSFLSTGTSKWTAGERKKERKKKQVALDLRDT